MWFKSFRVLSRFALLLLVSGTGLASVPLLHAQSTPTIVSASISPGSVVTDSVQRANVTVTVVITRPPAFINDNISVQCTDSIYIGASFGVPPGLYLATGAVSVRSVGGPVTATMNCYVYGTKAEATMTLLPNTPTITFDSTSLPSGATTNVSISLVAPVPTDVTSFPVTVRVVPPSIGNG